MADVYTVLFTLIGILLTLPALLVGLNLLLPTIVQRVETRLKETPGRSFLMGAPVTGLFFVVVLVANQFPGPGQAVAVATAVSWMGLGTVGAAGMARLLSARFASISHPSSELLNLVRGAAVYELSCLFPLVGWFLFAPLVGFTVVGAAMFALLGWLPHPVRRDMLTVTQEP